MKWGSSVIINVDGAINVIRNQKGKCMGINMAKRLDYVSTPLAAELHVIFRGISFATCMNC